MIKFKYKYRLYDLRKVITKGLDFKWKYVGMRNVYRDEIGNVYILQNNLFIPASFLRDSKGSYVVTNYSKTYAIRRKNLK